MPWLAHAIPDADERDAATVIGAGLSLREAIEDLLTQQESVTAAQVAAQYGHRRQSCAVRLWTMARDGDLLRVRCGVYAAPKRKVRLG